MKGCYLFPLLCLANQPCSPQEARPKPKSCRKIRVGTHSYPSRTALKPVTGELQGRAFGTWWHQDQKLKLDILLLTSGTVTKVGRITMRNAAWVIDISLARKNNKGALKAAVLVQGTNGIEQVSEYLITPGIDVIEQARRPVEGSRRVYLETESAEIATMKLGEMGCLLETANGNTQPEKIPCEYRLLSRGRLDRLEIRKKGGSVTVQPFPKLSSRAWKHLFETPEDFSKHGSPDALGGAPIRESASLIFWREYSSVNRVDSVTLMSAIVTKNGSKTKKIASHSGPGSIVHFAALEAACTSGGVCIFVDNLALHDFRTQHIYSNSANGFCTPDLNRVRDLIPLGDRSEVYFVGLVGVPGESTELRLVLQHQ